MEARCMMRTQLLGVVVLLWGASLAQSQPGAAYPGGPLQGFPIQQVQNVSSPNGAAPLASNFTYQRFSGPPGVPGITPSGGNYLPPNLPAPAPTPPPAILPLVAA